MLCIYFSVDCIEFRLHSSYVKLQKLNHALETKLLATVSFIVSSYLFIYGNLLLLVC